MRVCGVSGFDVLCAFGVRRSAERKGLRFSRAGAVLGELEAGVGR